MRCMQVKVNGKWGSYWRINDRDFVILFNMLNEYDVLVTTSLHYSYVTHEIVPSLHSEVKLKRRTCLFL